MTTLSFPSKQALNRCSIPLEDVLNRGYRYALSLTNDADFAQDLLQEACLKICQRGGPWDVKYLIVVIRHCHVDAYRRAPKVCDADLELLVGEPDVAYVAADEALAQALAQLRAEEREALFLSAVEGYSAAQIAKLTKRPRGTILSLIHRAKKKVRQLLVKVEVVS